jgi:hypothetical protein
MFQHIEKSLILNYFTVIVLLDIYLVSSVKHFLNCYCLLNQTIWQTILNMAIFDNDASFVKTDL